jgi:twinkle protein
MISFSEISRLLAQQPENVAHYLLPGGKKKGHEYHVGSIGGEPGESLKVHLSGPKSGLWCDFASGSEGYRGDLLDLWSAVRSIGLKQAAEEASKYLGIDKPREGIASKVFERPVLEGLKKLHGDSLGMRYLIETRKLDIDVILKFKIVTKGNDLVFPYLRDGELVMAKYLSLPRVDTKKQMRATTATEPCLFGWDAIPHDSKEITICEGEIDAMSLHQYGINALSVPFGAGNHQWVEYDFDRLSYYDVIYICFDNDDAGKKGAEQLVQRLGAHRCKLVKLPFKDANECLFREVPAFEIKKCFANAMDMDPPDLKGGDEFSDEVMAEMFPKNGAKLGIETPWQKAQGKIIFRPAELSVWTGINGHGKSQILGHLAVDAMAKGRRVFIASLELRPPLLLKKMTMQAAGLGREDISEEYALYIQKWWKDKIWVFNFLGEVTIDTLIDRFTYAYQKYQVDMFIVDSFLKLKVKEEDFEAQRSAMEKLTQFKNTYPVHVHLIAHPRKGADEQTRIGKIDIKGSGAISDMADNSFSVFRNKKKEEFREKKSKGIILKNDEEKYLEMADSILKCDKNRNGDYEGSIGLYFSKETFQFLDSENQRPKQYVEYSKITDEIKD